MGQHKYNETAIKAKNGELPPKPKKMTKTEIDRILYQRIRELMPDLSAFGIESYYNK